MTGWAWFICIDISAVRIWFRLFEGCCVHEFAVKIHIDL